MWKVIFLLIPLVFSCSFQPSNSIYNAPVEKKPISITNNNDDTNTVPASVFYGEIQTTNYSGKYEYDNMFIIYMYADNDLSYDYKACEMDIGEIVDGVYRSSNRYTGFEGYYDTNTAIFLIVEKNSYHYIGSSNYNFTPYFYEPSVLSRFIAPEGVYFLKVSNAPFMTNVCVREIVDPYKVFYRDIYAYFERIYIETNHSYSSVEKAISNLNAITKLGVKAKTTNLIIWNHGNAVFPMGNNDTIEIKTNYSTKYIGYSETEDKSISEEELVYIIKSVFENNKLTTLFFDACSMFLIEEIYYYKDLANWFVGSAYPIYYLGFDYVSLIRSFVSNNNVKSALYEFISNYNTKNGEKKYDGGNISSSYDLYFISAVSSEGINEYINYLEQLYDLIMSSSFQTRFFYSISYPFSCMNIGNDVYSEPFIFKTVFSRENFYRKGYAFSAYFDNWGGRNNYYYFDATDIRNAVSNLIIILNTNALYKPEIAPFIVPDIPKFVSFLNQYQNNFLNNNDYFIYSHDFPALMFIRRPFPYTYSINYSVDDNDYFKTLEKIEKYNHFYYHNKLLKDKPKVKELLNGKAIDNGTLAKIYFALKQGNSATYDVYENIIYNILTEKTNYQDLNLENPNERLKVDWSKPYHTMLGGITYLENSIIPIYTFTNKNNLFDYYLYFNLPIGGITNLYISYIFSYDNIALVSGLEEFESYWSDFRYGYYYIYEYYKMQTNFLEIYCYNTNYTPHKLVKTLFIPAFVKNYTITKISYDTNLISSEPFHYFKLNVRGIYSVNFKQR